ncbi:hypothetical protein [Oceanobacillus locisalsi]|uniref:Uncharacterized protein n=1 Tax=Oceanobacillus locisalsi TaxID=546107 RepID=A0ABW3NEJ5_9BACI
MTVRQRNYLDASIVTALFILIILFVDAIPTGGTLVILGFNVALSLSIFELKLLYKKNKEKEEDGNDSY